MHSAFPARLALLAFGASLPLAAPLACSSTPNTSSSDSGSPPDAPDSSPPDVSVDVHEPDAHPTVQVTMNAYTPGGEGANTNETYLNVTNVNAAKFGALFTLPVDGDQYAQPLYMGGLTMNDGKKHNVVFLATSHDTVFAYDADVAAKPLWQAPLGTSAPLPSPYLDFQWATSSGCSQYSLNESGITSTPVIDPATNTMYVVALDIDTSSTSPGGTCLQTSMCASGVATTTPCNAYTATYKLYALDLATGQPKFGGPVAIGGSVPGSGAGSVTGTLTFDAGLELQRPSLLLSNGTVYFAAGSYNDAGNYHGWMFAYDATSLKQTGIFNDTPNGARGGIWQSGRGPLADSAGNVYIVTGQGTFDVGTGGDDYSDSLLRFDTADAKGLSKVGDYFTQFLSDYQMNNFPDDWDDDMGSSGATLIPGTSMILVSGKMGMGYLLDRNNLGKWSPTGDSVVQKLRITWRSNKTSCTDGVIESWVYGTPIAWVGPDGTHVYVWSTQDSLRDYLLDGSGKIKDSGHLCWCDPWVVPTASGNVSISVSDPNCAAPNSEGTVSLGALSPGAALAVSSFGKASGTGILWATYSTSGDSIHTSQPGVLAAYDATNVSTPIWISSNSAKDTLGNWAKFSPPTVANGKVYTATFSNKLVVYGLLP